MHKSILYNFNLGYEHMLSDAIESKFDEEFIEHVSGLVHDEYADDILEIHEIMGDDIIEGQIFDLR